MAVHVKKPEEKKPTPAVRKAVKKGGLVDLMRGFAVGLSKPTEGKPPKK